eukprot:COSAG06_NODE_48224_length_333_cov_1.504274_2_plen_30_part_01
MRKRSIDQDRLGKHKHNSKEALSAPRQGKT